MNVKTGAAVLVLAGVAVFPLVAQDWPMWGGAAQRNLTSAMKNLPESWDVKSGKNIKWKAQIGSTSYGNPVVANAKIFLGTNNGNPRNPNIQGDRGVLMCFRESDGEFLWQVPGRCRSPVSHCPGPLIGLPGTEQKESQPNRTLVSDSRLETSWHRRLE